jgi:hypothetical protein
VLPDFQGLGLGAHGLPNTVGAIIRALGGVCIVQTSHPGLIAAWAKSTAWQMTARPHIPGSLSSSSSSSSSMQSTSANGQGRRIASFRYAGKAHADVEEARRLWL